MNIDNNKTKIAYFEDCDIDEIIKRHIELVTTPILEVKNWYNIPTTNTEFKPEYNIVKEKQVAPRKIILYHKYIFLISLIIERCIIDKANSTKLSYTIMSNILGKHYSSMLINLDKMGLIKLGSTYCPGSCSRIITLNNNKIKTSIIQNKKVYEYFKLLKTYFSEIRIKKLKNYGDDNFIKKYELSLSLLELKNKDEAIKYINNKRFNKEASKEYYLNKINAFSIDSKEIYSIDSNKRIYHYLTNLPRDLKCFFNIKFQCDIHNSHPLLFSSFLIDRYKIDNNIIKLLLSISIDYTQVKPYHYLRRQLCNILKINHIDKRKIKGIPWDIFKFIYTTSKGNFWDTFLNLFVGFQRSDIKTSMFREVFYSNKVKSVIHRPFAKIFKKEYPNVWKIINYIKTNNDNLPNLMMLKESLIFYNILKRCYKLEWKVISIHDAIIVLDVEQNNNFDIDTLIKIMTDVYVDNNLYPSISIEKNEPI